MNDITLRVKVPTRDTPGYLRRMIQVRDINRKFENVDDLDGIQQIDAMIEIADFLKDYVEVEPPELDKLEVLYDLSMNEFMEIMNEFGKMASPPKKSTQPNLSSGSRKLVTRP